MEAKRSLEDRQSRRAVGRQDTRNSPEVSSWSKKAAGAPAIKHVFQTAGSRKGKCFIPVEIPEVITHSAHIRMGLIG